MQPALAMEVSHPAESDDCPEIIAANPSWELCTRLIAAIIMNGPANDNKEVVDTAARYLEYTLVLSGSWKPHPLKKTFTVDHMARVQE